VAAVRLHAFEDLACFGRHLAVEPVDQKFGIAEHGVQRRAQFVTHIGEELRLVLIGDLQLPAALLHLAEQFGIVHGDHRLIGEGLHQADGVRRKIARGPALYDERAEDFLRSDQRQDENRVEAGGAGEFADAMHVGVLQLGDGDRLALERRFAQHAFGERNGSRRRMGLITPLSKKRGRCAICHRQK